MSGIIGKLFSGPTTPAKAAWYDPFDPQVAFDPDRLHADLTEIFERHGVSVAVGKTRKGVAIRSQDERVLVGFIGAVKAHKP